MEAWLTRVWYGGARGGWILLPLSALYAAVIAVRRWAYSSGLKKSYRVGKPVVIVGNLTVGGTGKTPLVVWLAQQLQSRGLKVAIVSRGYGSQGGLPREVSSTSANWREVGDEPVLIARRSACRVFVSADRVAAAREAVKSGADIVVSDDGLQHLRLARDTEIVVIDGARGLGNGRQLPAGPLRESAHRLGAVDLAVINGNTVAADVATMTFSTDRGPLGMQLLATHVVPVRALRAGGDSGVESLDTFRGRRVHAVAGIGNPERFFKMLRTREIDAIEHAFPDHHPFAASELSFADDLPILMTEKDAVRCESFANDRMKFIPVSAELSESDARRLLETIDYAANASRPATR